MTTFRQEHSISTLEIRLQLQYDDFNAYENKAQGYINMSAILIAVLGLFSFTEEKIPTYEKVLIGIFLISVGWVFCFSFLTMKLSKWKAPTGTTKEDLEQFQGYVKSSVDEPYFERMFDTYVDCLTTNKNTLDKKRRCLVFAEYGLYVESVLIFILVILSIW